MFAYKGCTSLSTGELNLGPLLPCTDTGPGAQRWGGGLFCRAPTSDAVFRRLCHTGGLLSPSSASTAGPHHLTQDSGRATGVCYDLHPGMPKMTRGSRSFDFSISGDWRLSGTFRCSCHRKLNTIPRLSATSALSTWATHQKSMVYPYK